MFDEKLVRPNDISSRVLEKHAFQHDVSKRVRRTVERFKEANEQEQRSIDVAHLKHRVAELDSRLSPERVDAIVKYGLSKRTGHVVPTERSPTAVDLRRASRKAMVKARRSARR